MVKNCEFFSHFYILVRCKILQLDVEKKQFNVFLYFAIEMAVLSVLDKKKALVL